MGGAEPDFVCLRCRQLDEKTPPIPWVKARSGLLDRDLADVVALYVPLSQVHTRVVGYDWPKSPRSNVGVTVSTKWNLRISDFQKGVSSLSANVAGGYKAGQGEKVRPDPGATYQGKSMVQIVLGASLTAGHGALVFLTGNGRRARSSERLTR